MQEWIQKLFQGPAMTIMGHGQSVEDLNLGLGWVYYGLARALRPTTAVVIGSYRGFVPLIIGKALQDNGDGRVVFIDPSMVDDFWKTPDEVRAHFAEYGVTNIDHHLATTQDFVKSQAYGELSQVRMLYVDGFHTEEQARFDHEAFVEKLTPEAVVLFHDSVRERVSRIYGKDNPYSHTVCRYMDTLRSDPAYEVLSLPLSDGITLVKKRHSGAAIA